MTFEWPIDRTCLPELPVVPVLGDTPTVEEQAAHDAAQAAYDDALSARNAAEDLAVHVLWALSGRQFGVRRVLARPGTQSGWPCSPWMTVWDWGTWSPFGCGCAFHCTLAAPARVHLPGPVFVDGDHPVVVTLAGDVLDPAGYAVEGDLLYRRDGARWPPQNLARPLDEPGTWSVSYWLGIPVPAGVDRLTGALAKEFMRACDGGQCRLPPTLVATNSRGQSHSFDPARILAAGYTGLTEVDRWLAAVNPNRLMCQAEVL